MKKTLIINEYTRLTLSPNGCWPHGADTVVRLAVTTTGVVRWRSFAHLSTHLSADERYYVQVAVQEHSAESITSLSQVG